MGGGQVNTVNGDFVFEVFHLDGQLALEDLDFVEFGVDFLKLVQLFELFTNGLFCSHTVLLPFAV